MILEEIKGDEKGKWNTRIAGQQHQICRDPRTTNFTIRDDTVGCYQLAYAALVRETDSWDVPPGSGPREEKNATPTRWLLLAVEGKKIGGQRRPGSFWRLGS